jgi:hypothetical protein
LTRSFCKVGMERPITLSPAINEGRNHLNFIVRMIVHMARTGRDLGTAWKVPIKIRKGPQLYAMTGLTPIRNIHISGVHAPVMAVWTNTWTTSRSSLMSPTFLWTALASIPPGGLAAV